jgi:hypothetical protein
MQLYATYLVEDGTESMVVGGGGGDGYCGPVITVVIYCLHVASYQAKYSIFNVFKFLIYTKGNVLTDGNIRGTMRNMVIGNIVNMVTSVLLQGTL